MMELGHMAGALRATMRLSRLQSEAYFSTVNVNPA